MQQEPIRAVFMLNQMNPGGGQSVIMEYARHADPARVRFDFIVGEDSTAIPYEEIAALGGRVYTVPPMKKLPAYLRAVEKLCAENRYQVAHCPMSTLSIFPIWAARRAGVPVRINENLSMAHPSEKKTWVKNLLRLFSRAGATHFMCNGQDCGRWLFGDRLYDRGDVALFLSPVDTRRDRFDPALREEARAKLQLTDNFVIGHIGRFEPQKNTVFLIDVFAAVCEREPRARLLLVGDGSLREQVLARIDALGVRDKVVYLGLQKEIVPLYQAMDLFLLPSLYEGLPIVGVEAQTAGLPTVYSAEITREAGLDELARFVPLSDSPAQWAQVILNAAAECGPRTDHSEQAARAGFDSRRETERLMDYYEQALGSPQTAKESVNHAV